MSVQNCPSCGGIHFGSNECVYDKQAEKLLNEAADFMAGNLPKPDDRAWAQLLIYCPLEILEAAYVRKAQRAPISLQHHSHQGETK